jgi:hypothetical protein
VTSAEYETFEEPVPVFVGLGYLTRIETVSQAYALLSDWPCGQRDPAHAVALNACKAALAREIDSETARSAFAAFASKKGILASEADPVVAAISTSALDRRIPG